MENTSQEQAPQPKELKKKGTSTGLLVGVIAFLFLLLVIFLLFVFTDIGNTLCSQVGVEECVKTEVEDEIKEDNTEVNSLENEGWALYSIPEYGFSVEIPDTKEDVKFEDGQSSVKRWEVSRIDANLYGNYINSLNLDNVEIAEVVDIEYAPLWVPYEMDAFRRRMLGVEELKVGVYDKKGEVTLEDIIAVKEEEFNDAIGSIPGGLNTLEGDKWADFYKSDAQIVDGAWCVSIPNIAGEPYQDCYVVTDNNIFQVSYEGMNRITGEVSDIDRLVEREKVVNSMKFE